ncbi:MAG: haloalkane dehalogenase, partial [bacterium]|nr:haloalkane dehalogenase [bacterium]
TTTVLLLHGEPTWGYLFRKMIPPLVAAGYRALVPDLIGFGRSDKPVERSAYTYAGHVEWMRQFLAATAAERGGGPLHLFGQDWGGLIGLRVAAENPDLVDRLIMANTGLPEGQSPGAGFEFWLQFSQEVDYLDCGRLVDNATATELSESAQEAYRAPFPSEQFMAGARHFPMLVPISPADPAVPANRAAWQVLEQWTKPVLTLWAPDDPVLGGGQAAISERIPGAAGQPHAQFHPASHFIQEDQGPALAEAIIAWLG